MRCISGRPFPRLACLVRTKRQSLLLFFSESLYLRTLTFLEGLETFEQPTATQLLHISS